MQKYIPIAVNFLIFILFSFELRAQCPASTTITNNQCFTVSTAGNTGGFLSGCNGGNHPYVFLNFVAPSSCVQFNISNITNAGGGAWQYRIMNSTCSAYPGVT